MVSSDSVSALFRDDREYSRPAAAPHSGICSAEIDQACSSIECFSSIRVALRQSQRDNSSGQPDCQMGSKKSFFSVSSTSGSHIRPGSQGSTPRRTPSSSSLARNSKPGWAGVYPDADADSVSTPSSRRPSFSEDGESGVPRTPPLRRTTQVKAEGGHSA